MKHITIDHLVASNTLYAQPERNIVDTMAPLEILRLTVDPYRESGLGTVGSFMGKGSLKMMNSDGRWFNSKGRSYCIAEKTGEELVTESWSLTSEESFLTLQNALREGKMLLQAEKAISGTNQMNWLIIFTKKDAELIKLSYDSQTHWYELSRAYLNHVMRSLVRWESHPSSARAIQALCNEDVDNLLDTGSGEVMDPVEGFVEYMGNTLRDVREEVEDFVEKDVWAFYYVGVDTRGVYISKHRDVRAILWERQRTEELDIKERDA